MSLGLTMFPRAPCGKRIEADAKHAGDGPVPLPLLLLFCDSSAKPDPLLHSLKIEKQIEIKLRTVSGSLGESEIGNWLLLTSEHADRNQHG